MNQRRLTSLGKVEQGREEHCAGDEEEEQGTKSIHTPFDCHDHDLDGHDDCRRVLECAENSQQSEQSQYRETEEYRLVT